MRKVGLGTNLEVFVDHDVFVFDVAVSDSVAVEIVHGVDDLGKDIPRLSLVETFVRGLLDALKQVIRGTAG
jgi:hypothetical protein